MKKLKLLKLKNKQTSKRENGEADNNKCKVAVSNPRRSKGVPRRGRAAAEKHQTCGKSGSFRDQQ